jgi:hypothetical protein
VVEEMVVGVVVVMNIKVKVIGVVVEVVLVVDVDAIATIHIRDVVDMVIDHIKM